MNNIKNMYEALMETTEPKTTQQPITPVPNRRSDACPH